MGRQKRDGKHTLWSEGYAAEKLLFVADKPKTQRDGRRRELRGGGRGDLERWRCGSGPQLRDSRCVTLERQGSPFVPDGSVGRRVGCLTAKRGGEDKQGGRAKEPGARTQRKRERERGGKIKQNDKGQKHGEPNRVQKQHNKVQACRRCLRLPLSTLSFCHCLHPSFLHVWCRALPCYHRCACNSPCGRSRRGA